MTTVEWPSEEEESDADGFLLLLHQFPRHIVDSGDVVGVNGVVQAKNVGRQDKGRGLSEYE